MDLNRLRALAKRHRTAIIVVGSLATAAILVLLVAGRREGSPRR